MQALAAPRTRATASYLVFAAFGAFWGVWGASIPRIRAHSGVSDGQLGIALLCIGGGALPAMLLTGRAVDRWGPRVAAVMLVALGVVGIAVTATAVDLVSLCAGLAVLGACSGATDVAMNSMAGDAERMLDRPVLTRAAGAFSAFVVIGSLGAGAAAGAGASTTVPFAGAGVLGVAVALVVLRIPRAPGEGQAATSAPLPVLDRRLVLPLVIMGVLGALAFGSENAYQSWGAVFFQDELGASAGWSAVAPAVFAAVVAGTRFGLGAIPPRLAGRILVLGAATAGAGALVVSRAEDPIVAFAGLVLAAAGTGGLFPTILSIAARNVSHRQRGRATSIISTVAYLGFLLGPVYVGYWAGVSGLRGAMVAIAVLGVALAALAMPALRLSGFVIHVERQAGLPSASPLPVAGQEPCRADITATTAAQRQR
jgi:MFS family permease